MGDTGPQGRFSVDVNGAYQAIDGGGGAVAYLASSDATYTLWDLRYEISSLFQPVVEWSVAVIQVDSSRMTLQASSLMHQ